MIYKSNNCCQSLVNFYVALGGLNKRKLLWGSIRFNVNIKIDMDMSVRLSLCVFDMCVNHYITIAKSCLESKFGLNYFARHFSRALIKSARDLVVTLAKV